MKKTAVALLFVIVASILLPCTIVRAEPAFIPHEDPAAADSALDAYSFLSQYVEILSLISAQQYENASVLTEQLAHISVPEDLSYIINRYNNLTQELIQVLKELRDTLDSASALLDQYRLDEASQALNRAGVLVAKAQILLEDLQDATSTLSQRIGVFAAPAESKIRQAYNELQNLLQRLNDLINQYHDLLRRINSQAEEIKLGNLKSTTLSLNLNTTSCFVGGFVSASGRLTSNGENLQNRGVKLLLDGEQIGNAATSADGSYQAVIQIPYKYVQSVIIQALYTPAGSDKGVYLASSNSVSVTVLFYETSLIMTTPSEGYPGLSLTANGKITSQEGTSLSEREVKLFFDGNTVGTAQTDSTGTVSIQFTVDSQTKTGQHKLTMIVSPKGVYAGTSQQRTISILKIASTITVNAPSFVVLPAEINVDGTVSSASKPLKNAEVTLSLATTTVTVKSLEDGSFNATLTVPLNAVFAGAQELNVTVKPSESWQASTKTQVNIFLISSANVGFASAAFVSVGVVFYMRFVRSKPKKSEKKDTRAVEITPQLQPEDASADLISSKPEFQFEGAKGKVLEEYNEALRTVETVTQSSLEPQMTLREFLKKVKPKLRGASEAFTALTSIAERALYSPFVPETEDIQKAEALGATIREVLGK
ncbi:MAG: hypothetical protein NWF00_09550 [Candidatus Bathyarchaeota archaeon]|nr:hypothetical protein [Candidatus Bathyarchaeota archaeon]